MSRCRSLTGIMRRAVRCQFYLTAAARRFSSAGRGDASRRGSRPDPPRSCFQGSVFTHRLIAPALAGSDLWLSHHHLRMCTSARGMARIAALLLAQLPMRCLLSRSTMAATASWAQASGAVLTARIIRFDLMVPKGTDLSEQALGSHNAPMPSKLMTRVRFPSPAPIPSRLRRVSGGKARAGFLSCHRAAR